MPIRLIPVGSFAQTSGIPLGPPIAGIPALGALGGATATAGNAITQNTRLDNTNAFYAGTVTQSGAPQTVTQGTRFDNAQTYYAGTVTSIVGVTQGTRFDNAQTFYAGSISTTGPLQTVTQGARFDNTQDFYAGNVSVSGALQPITQAARFDNAQTFYTGSVTTVYSISQATRFDNAQAFYAGTITQGFASQAITQATRFDNSQTFYAGVVTQTGGVSPVVQTARFDNPNSFFGGVVTGGAEPEPLIGGHYGAWWADKYRKMFERPPTVAEVVEFVKEEPQEAVQIVKQVSPNAVIGVTWKDIKGNIKLQNLIAEQIITAAKMRQIAIEREEDDIEAMLLLD